MYPGAPDRVGSEENETIMTAGILAGLLWIAAGLGFLSYGTGNLAGLLGGVGAAGAATAFTALAVVFWMEAAEGRDA